MAIEMNEIKLGIPDSLEEKIVFLQMAQPRGTDFTAEHYVDTIFKVFGQIATVEAVEAALAAIDADIVEEAEQWQNIEEEV